MKRPLVLIILIILTISTVSAAGGGSGGISTVNRENTQKTTPSPAEAKQEQAKCADLTSINERVSCRIGRIKKGQETEFDPEECRTSNNKEKCRSFYVAANTCWSEKINEGRVNCFRNYLKFKTIQEGREKCLQLQTQKDECFKELHERVFSIIKFRFYNLENRAEYFLQEGANQETVSSFISNVELDKQKFNDAKTIQEKKEIIKQVKTLWQDFIKEIKPQLRE